MCTRRQVADTDFTAVNRLVSFLIRHVAESRHTKGFYILFANLCSNESNSWLLEILIQFEKLRQNCKASEMMKFLYIYWKFCRVPPHTNMA